MIFLIHYDRSTRSIENILKFDDRQSASRKKISLEIELIGHTNSHEIVILEANDETDLKNTHKRYFSDLTKYDMQGK